MAPRHILVILACVPLASCAATQADTTTPHHPTSATAHSPAAGATTHSWQPNAVPHPISRFGDTTSVAPAPDDGVERPAPKAGKPPAEVPSPTQVPSPQVATVTVHAPAPRPAPPQRRKPTLDLPQPPRIPTSIPIPPEIQNGLDQVPKLPPLPKAEDVYIDVPF